ncbi:MAG: hypothetical protein M1816_007356 [Peltula sp. TS41687]|nr:MAG: hypothetical protein M1816_007356 [Peltula sp. TS41687]
MATQASCLEIAKTAAQRVGLPENRIVLIGDGRDGAGRFKHFTAIRNTSAVSRFRRPRITPSGDLAYLVYSSGTTGYPKGVMLSHRNIISNILMLAHVEGVNIAWDRNSCLAVLPFFHIFGLSCQMHQAIYNGFTLVVMPRFDLEKFCRAVQSFKITFAFVVPPIVLLLSKHPVVDQYDLSSLRMLTSGAAPLTKELMDAFYRRLKVPIKQGYGLSETSPTTHVCPWNEWDKVIGSVGRLLPNQSAKYISPEGQEVAPGQAGELCVKGPNIFQGYLNNPDGTRAAFDSDGYFKTGDVGYQDHDGNFFITDRVKELIKYKGFQVAPAEIEGLLASHPMIDDVAVIGVYDDTRASEVPRAFVVLAQGVQRGPDTEKEIVQWLNARVANHKWLRGGVRFTDEIPKSASGKILRRILKVRDLKEEQGVRAKL